MEECKIYKEGESCNLNNNCKYPNCETGIKDNNKLIAEFMDTTYEQKKNTHGVVLYEVSWDWLMPVVNKIIFKTKEPKEGSYRYCDLHEDILLAVPSINIEEVYKVVVKFIKWHNENNESNQS